MIYNYSGMYIVIRIFVRIFVIRLYLRTLPVIRGQLQLANPRYSNAPSTAIMLTAPLHWLDPLWKECVVRGGGGGKVKLATLSVIRIYIKKFQTKDLYVTIF